MAVLFVVNFQLDICIGSKSQKEKSYETKCGHTEDTARQLSEGIDDGDRSIVWWRWLIVCDVHHL